MTREDLMANRILPKVVVSIISDDYYMDNYPSWEELTGGTEDDEEISQRTYVSDEKIQRMPPEEVVDVLVQYPEYEVRKTDDIIRVLSAATGRTEDELRNAIFGVGDFDAKKFYSPTEKQKAIIKAFFSILRRLQKVHVGWQDHDHWTQDCKDDWDKVLADIPDEAIPSEMQEANEYIEYYIKHGGVPAWLY